MRAIFTPAIKRRRGIAMIMALFIVGLLLAIGMLLLDNVMSVATNAVDVRQKNQIFDAAEAGLNAALDVLDRTPTATPGPAACPSDNVGGYDYQCGIIVNDFFGGATPPPIDPITGLSIASVPQGFAIVYGTADNGAGERTVTAEALVALQTSNLQMPGGGGMPGGAGNSKGGIGGSTAMTISGELTSPNDANLYADGNIAQFETLPNNIHGNTFAVGTDAQVGADGLTHPNAQPVIFPSDTAVQKFAAAEAATARSGTYIPAATFVGNATPQIYTGNVYIDGDVNMTQNVATFNGGGAVYINGSLCVSGSAVILNAGGSTFVVRDQFVMSGSSQGYTITPGTKGVMVVTGGDKAPPCSSGTGPSAVHFSGSGTSSVGLIYAPFGSIQLAGACKLTGDLVAGVNLLFNGGAASSFTYDSNVAGLALKGPGTVKVKAFAEYETKPTN